MGSDSDLPVMAAAATVLDELGVAHRTRIVSAHRTPEVLFEVGRTAHTEGYRVIIAGAGGAAHLPGMLASLSPLPVIGVPIKSRNSLDGWDSLLSIVQMPAGVPVATVAVDGARNAGILAAQMLATGDDALRARVAAFKDRLRDAVVEKASRLRSGPGDPEGPR
ncbi:MAG: 5-(carboxyamino)imidazole ribonucleotide mutase [Myxococcota bacterium]